MVLARMLCSRDLRSASAEATVLFNELGYATWEVRARAADEDGEELFGLPAASMMSEQPF